MDKVHIQSFGVVQILRWLNKSQDYHLFTQNNENKLKCDCM